LTLFFVQVLFVCRALFIAQALTTFESALWLVLQQAAL
jgi:hypothetical protein